MLNHARKWDHILCGSAERWDRQFDVVKEPKMWDQVNCMACCVRWTDPILDKVKTPDEESGDGSSV